MRTKTFDCVQMKRQGAELVRRQLEGKSFEEQLEYWRKGTEELRKLQVQAREKDGPRTESEK
ncbi:MAG: hypothetical protein ACYS0H_29740 [Planctomycetota bacterium]|jgi:hypothetical protein